MTDPNTVRRIVRAARLHEDDVVLEVGPGLGSLTLALLPHARSVVAVEIDAVLAEQLPRTVAERLPDLRDRLVVLTADALRLEALPQRAHGAGRQPPLQRRGPRRAAPPRR